MPIKKVQTPVKVEPKKAETKPTKKIEKVITELPEKTEVETPPTVPIVKPSLVLPDKFTIGLVGSDPIVKQFAGHLKLKGGKIQQEIKKMLLNWFSENKIEYKQ